MSKEPIRHHYIPQFILRNFCFDKDNNFYYHDKGIGKTVVKNTRDVFMVKNLYRDAINSPNQQTKIETDLAKYECEVAEIINNRFLQDYDISITSEEDEKLKLFFAIMGFRNYSANLLFSDNTDEDFKDFYGKYQNDGNFNDLWKRNLGELANCRSFSEVLSNPSIDEPIKLFMRRDTQGYFGKYFVVAERRGNLDFVIGDAYPTVENGINDNNGLEVKMYELFPIAPNRVIIFAYNGVKAAPKAATGLDSNVFTKPRINRENGNIEIHVRKVYSNDVKFINEEIITTSRFAFAFMDKKRVEL